MKKREQCTLLKEHKLAQPLWNRVRKFLKKLKTELSCDLAIPHLGTYPNELKSVSQKDICISMFIAALIPITKTWRQPKGPSTEEWIYIQWNVIQPLKRKKFCHLCQCE